MSELKDTQKGHGDVQLKKVNSIPENAKRVKPDEEKGFIVARGEVTGHTHRIEDVEATRMYEAPDGTVYIEALDDVTLQHEEHDPLTLEGGTTFAATPTYEADPYSNVVSEVQD